uniref:RING-type E3 ubiquitin transferase n=1 Tax=Kalanchoe fedtschenkoi TaxID=63787 RepID=A0A7N0UCM2_KALFE
MCAAYCVHSGADTAVGLIELVREIVKVSSGVHGSDFRRECTDLVRRISLLAHLFEEIRDLMGEGCGGQSGEGCRWVSDLVTALQAAKSLLPVAASFSSTTSSDGAAAKKIAFQFQCVTWKLEKALSNVPYDQFDISEEVQEQVDLVRAQLRRATERYGPLSSRVLSRALSEPLDQLMDPMQPSKRVSIGLHIDNIGNVDHEVKRKVSFVPKGNCSSSTDSLIDMARVSNQIAMSEICPSNETDAGTEDNAEIKDQEVTKKPEGPVIPDDFLCPISLELMRDPVIVATGQTFERSYIQRWIDSGNTTCPKTRQKLENLTLTPNYVLRSLISQWCTLNNIEQPNVLANGKIKRRDGTVRDVSGDLAAIQELVRKLSSRNIEECRNAAAEVRSLSKRSTDNRILLAEAGAIPFLVHLLTVEDELTQENAVTSILNLSIFENNKELIMLAGAIPSIVQVLRRGSMEARENAAATLFSLSLADENKIIIGASGAVQALVELLQNGSLRGKKDAATALFNLCIYQGNRGRAVRAGIVTALLKMLTDSTGSMVDEALTILSVLASHQEAKVAIVKASIIPVMIDLMRTGQARIKENAAAILLSLCKRDNDNLSAISRLGAFIPLSEIANSGTERAKRKATSLLELLRRLHHA